MGIILKPNIEIDNIKLDMVSNDVDNVNRVINVIGRDFPLIKIGNYVLNFGEVIDFNLKVSINNLPTFSLTIDDTNLQIREELKKEIDKCVIFIGQREVYIKFNGIVTITDSEAGDPYLHLTGIWFNPKLYGTEQKSYKDTKVIDIITDICKKTNIGLFSFNNSQLDNIIDYCINTETKLINFLVNDVIKKYTYNVFGIDCYGYLHICDISKLKSNPYDKYTILPNGTILEPKDIIFTSKTKRYDYDLDEFKIPINYYTLNSNFSKAFLDNASEYSVNFQGKNKKVLNTDLHIGYGNIGTNTYSGFNNQKFPFYDNIVNKIIGGNTITLTLNHIMLELSLFSIVGFDCYLPETGNKKFRLDEEHSGKKILIAYDLAYSKESKKINQTITLI